MVRFKLTYEQITQLNNFFSLLQYQGTLLQFSIRNKKLKVGLNENNIILITQLDLDKDVPNVEFCLTLQLIKQLYSLKKEYYLFEIDDTLLKIHFDKNVLNLSLLYGSQLNVDLTKIDIMQIPDEFKEILPDEFKEIQNPVELSQQLSLISNLPKDYNFYNIINFKDGLIYGEVFGNYFIIKNGQLELNQQIYYLYLPFIIQTLSSSDVKYKIQDNQLVLINEHSYIELPIYTQNIQPVQDFSTFKELTSFKINKQQFLDDLSILRLVPTSYFQLQLTINNNILQLQVNDISNIPSVFNITLQDLQGVNSLQFSLNSETLQKIITLCEDTICFKVLSEGGDTPTLLNIFTQNYQLYLPLSI